MIDEGAALLVSSLTAIFIVIILVLFLDGIIKMVHSKSKQARELMADLYVIGMIRKFAKEDNIDLEAEMKEFKRIQRLENIANKDLDTVIAIGLKEKLDAKNEKVIEEITKKK